MIEPVEYVAHIIAQVVHRDHKYGELDYIEHIYKVVNNVKSVEQNSTIIAAAYLHDTIEDGNVSYSFLKKLIGEEVTNIVFRVTDERGNNRREKHEKTYKPKIQNHYGPTIIKLSDRLANIEANTNHQKMLMYIKEHKYFIENISPEFDVIKEKKWTVGQITKITQLINKLNETVEGYSGIKK